MNYHIILIYVTNISYLVHYMQFVFFSPTILFTVTFLSFTVTLLLYYMLLAGEVNVPVMC